MKHSLHVINIKCGGCVHTITKALEKTGAMGVAVDIKSGFISYSGGPEKKDITSLLSSLGYPESGSPEAESFLKKAQSYVSCAIGKLH